MRKLKFSNTKILVIFHRVNNYPGNVAHSYKQVGSVIPRRIASITYFKAEKKIIQNHGLGPSLHLSGE